MGPYGKCRNMSDRSNLAVCNTGLSHMVRFPDVFVGQS